MKVYHDVINLVFCGVGGQGVLLASEVAAQVALEAGLDVKKSEVHGMAQRGGSVFSHVRLGRRVFSPVIPLGNAHVLVAFEELEALRYALYASPQARILVNTLRVNPITVLSGEASYPENPLGMLKKHFTNVEAVDALALAIEAGSPRAVNSVMLGLLSRYLPFDPRLWLTVLEQRVPAKAREINVKAFGLGRELSS
ncbi:MAG: indolepyruvate oxidoreductase subunit beta [Aquificota bacterium]|nr:MAG: indolepyruvate oxidoreductase subunit beta [Aquificota bacterium]